MPVQQLTPEHDERHRLDPDRELMRESLVWVLPLAEEGMGVVAYTWVDAFGKAGAAGFAFGTGLAENVFERVDGIDVPDTMTFSDWQAGPMRFGHQEPLHSSWISYRGERLEMDFTFESIHPPYAFSSHADGCPQYWADDRFEQGGIARGTIRVDGREIAVDGPCHRDHSFGARDWAATTHYKWMNFLTRDVSIHVMDLQGYGRTALRGYVARDGHTAEIVDADFDYVLDADFVHRTLTVRLTDDADRRTTVTLLRVTAELDYPISARLRLIDVIGPVEIDGAPGVAYAEMAWPPDYLEANRQAAAERNAVPA